MMVACLAMALLVQLPGIRGGAKIQGRGALSSLGNPCEKGASPPSRSGRGAEERLPAAPPAIGTPEPPRDLAPTGQGGRERLPGRRLAPLEAEAQRLVHRRFGEAAEQAIE